MRRSGYAGRRPAMRCSGNAGRRPGMRRLGFAGHRPAMRCLGNALLGECVAQGMQALLRPCGAVLLVKVRVNNLSTFQSSSTAVLS